MHHESLPAAAQTFVYKGTNERWRDILSDEDSHRYEATAFRELGRPCARWVAKGSRAD